MPSTLYTISKTVPHALIQTHSAHAHTMSESVNEYISHRIPTANIRKAVEANVSIEVHGIYPTHFERVAKQIGLKIIRPMHFKIHKHNKKYNFIRPLFFFARRDNTNVLVVSVPPGKDYLMHYSSMIKQFLTDLKIFNPQKFSVVHYPIAEKNLASWTKLSKRFVTRGDIVIIGYVEQAEKQIVRSRRWRRVGTATNDFYESHRYKSAAGMMVNFLGVKYSFWGNLSYFLIYQLCMLGASEIIYFGKLGTLTSPLDIYERLFAPSQFMIHSAFRLPKANDVKNTIAQHFPSLDSEGHLSVGTVLEESYTLRQLSDNLGIRTIDNEIAYMAKSISDYARKNKAVPRFGTIHFSTDYLRSNQEKQLLTSHDLSNHRTKSAMFKKNKIMKKAAIYLDQYLSSLKQSL